MKHSLAGLPGLKVAFNWHYGPNAFNTPGDLAPEIERCSNFNAEGPQSVTGLDLVTSFEVRIFFNGKESFHPYLKISRMKNNFSSGQIWNGPFLTLIGTIKDTSRHLSEPTQMLELSQILRQLNVLFTGWLSGKLN